MEGGSNLLRSSIHILSNVVKYAFCIFHDDSTLCTRRVVSIFPLVLKHGIVLSQVQYFALLIELHEISFVMDLKFIRFPLEWISAIQFISMAETSPRLLQSSNSLNVCSVLLSYEKIANIVTMFMVWKVKDEQMTSDPQIPTPKRFIPSCSARSLHTGCEPSPVLSYR